MNASVSVTVTVSVSVSDAIQPRVIFRGHKATAAHRPVLQQRLVSESQASPGRQRPLSSTARWPSLMESD